MRPRCAADSCEFSVGAVGWTIFPGSPVGDELEVESALALDFGFCAQGGRSGLSWVNAIPAKNSARAASRRGGWGRKWVIDI